MTASGATLHCLSGAQLFSAYLGEGEAILRDTFMRARLASPSIIFLDELDAVAGTARTLATLLSDSVTGPI